MPDFPALPAQIANLNHAWRVSLPPIAAARIAKAQRVYRDAGRLVCPVVERIAIEWEMIRERKPGLAAADARRLLGTLSYLLPGAPPEGMTPGRMEELTSEGWISDIGWESDAIGTEEVRTAAAYALGSVLAVHWRVRNRVALHRRAVALGVSAADAKVELCALGLHAATGDEADRRRVRLARQYLRGPDGSRDVVPLQDIPAIDYLRWIWAQTIRHARKMLRTDELGLESPTAADLPVEGPDTQPSPLDALVAAESARDELSQLLEFASPREVEILEEMRNALADGANKEEAIAEAAAALGLAPSTVRVHLHRMRKKRRAM